MPITKSTPLAIIIDDFVNSTDPKFAGKSKEERIRQAKGAFYGMQKEDHNESTNSMEEPEDDDDAFSHGYKHGGHNMQKNNPHKHGTRDHRWYEDGYNQARNDIKSNESLELIDAISEGDTIKSSEKFSSALMSRVFGLIEERREEVAQTMFESDKSLSDDLDRKANGADEVIHNNQKYVRSGPKNSTSQPGKWRKIKESIDPNKAEKGYYGIKYQPSILKSMSNTTSYTKNESVLPGHPYHNKNPLAGLKDVYHNTGTGKEYFKKPTGTSTK